jgi:hypothetical protein
VSKNHYKHHLEDSIKYKPSRREKRTLKGYEEAGHIYWTKDMERTLRGIHKAKYLWMTIALCELPVLFYFVVRYFN